MHINEEKLISTEIEILRNFLNVRICISVLRSTHPAVEKEEGIYSFSET